MQTEAINAPSPSGIHLLGKRESSDHNKERRPAAPALSTQKPLAQGSDILYPQELFRRALARERSLTLRFGHCFSLLEIELLNSEAPSRAAQLLSRHVSSRIRESDIAGWIDASCMGIILSDTSPANAWCLARAITEQMATHQVEVQCRVDACAPTPDADGSAGAPSLGDEPPSEVETLLFAGVPRWKRSMDVLLATLGLAALTPLLILIATGIEIVSPGPVLFKQKRIGHLGQPYTCWKFRSMLAHADEAQHIDHMRHLLHSNVPMTKLEDTNSDARLIPMGRFFRASGLDELPQLFNVLCGQMSLVGPRPCLPYEFCEFSQWQRDRCTTPPGLTGLWQVSGKNKTTFEQMMRFDVQYAKHRSLAMDLRLILSTPVVVLSQLGSCLGSKLQAQSETNQSNPQPDEGVLS